MTIQDDLDAVEDLVEDDTGLPEDYVKGKVAFGRLLEYVRALEAVAVRAEGEPHRHPLLDEALDALDTIRGAR